MTAPSAARSGGPEVGSHREVVARLAAAQKSGKGAPAWSRFVNRPLGRQLAAVAYRLGLTPNAVTVVSGVVTFSGIAVLGLVPWSWASGTAVVVLLVLGYALDAADGQLARLRGGGSVSGEWLDHMVDSAKISTLHLVTAVALHRWGGLDDVWLLVPLGFSAVAAVSFFAQILNEQLLKARTGSGQVGQASTLVSLAKVPTDYGILCLVFVLIGAPPVFLAVYGLLGAASAAYLALALVKWFGQMRALDARAS